MRSGQRVTALDALRGLSVLAMMLSGVIPFGPLPGWMYHAQEPPPTHQYNPNLPGVTWVDLVFPTCLFAMGTAIPFALARRIKNEEPWWKLALGALSRGGLLIAFAIFDQHVRPYSMAESPSPAIWATGLGAFFIGLLMFGRFPYRMPQWAEVAVKVLGWGLAFWLLATLRYPDGPGKTTGFNLGRNDIIIMVLAWCAAIGTLVWLATRNSILGRLGVIFAIFCGRVGATVEGSLANQAFYYSPLSWAPRPEFSHYLIIVLAGTIIGDRLAQPATNETTDRWPTWRYAVLCLGAFLAVPWTLFVHYQRLPSTWLLPIALLAAIVLKPKNDHESKIHDTVTWSLAWLLFGTLIEPFQGGIKKDPVTLSFMMTMTGLAGLLLTSLLVLPRRWPVRLVEDVGANPMLAYLGVTNLAGPIWALVFPLVVSGPLNVPQLVWAAFGQTLLLALLVSGFTKLRIFFRT